MPVQISPQVGFGYHFRHHLQAERPADDPGFQVPLGIKDAGILIGIFVDHPIVMIKQGGQFSLRISGSRKSGLILGSVVLVRLGQLVGPRLFQRCDDHRGNLPGFDRALTRQPRHQSGNDGLLGRLAGM